MALTPKELGNWAWRDYADPNTPIPGTEHEPLKSEIRDYVAGVEDQAATTLAVANAALVGITWSTQTIRVRSTANVAIATALENGDTLNGVVLATGDHVFLGSQTAPAENGLYTVPAAGAAARATFANSAAELARIGFLITEGTVGAGERWMLPLAAADITLETTSLTFAQVGIEVDYAAEVVALQADLDAFRDSVYPPRLVTMGASHVNRNVLGDQTGGLENVYTQPVGLAAWSAILYPWFEWDCWFDATTATYFTNGCNWGYPGETEVQIASHYADVVGLAPDVFVFEPGGNGVEAGASAATEFAGIEEICNRMRAAGSRVVLCNVKPRSAWTVGSAKFIVKEALNVLIAAYCAGGAAVLANIHDAIDDGTGMPATGMLGDGIHYLGMGAWTAARDGLVPALKHVIKPLLKDGPHGINLVTNPTQVTSGGTASTGVTGTVGADWAAACFSGCTAVGAVAGGERVFTLTGGGTAEEALVISREFGGVPVVAGTWVRGYADIRLSDWSGWRHPEFLLTFAGGTSISLPYDSTAIIDTNGVEVSLRLMTPPVQVPTGESSVSPALRLRLDGREAGTGNMTIEMVWISEVPDPRPKHGRD